MLLHQAGTFRLQIGNLVVNIIDFLLDIIVMLDENFLGNDSNLLIVFYVQIMPDDFVMQLHRF